MKENQPRLHSEVQAVFDRGLITGFRGLAHESASTTERSHGRSETRTAWVTHDLSGISDKEAWASVKCIAMVELVRTVGEKTTVFNRFFISSMAGATAAATLSAVRAHWGIENKLHGCLDIGFRADESRLRVGHAAENMARLRHISLNLLKK